MSGWFVFRGQSRVLFLAPQGSGPNGGPVKIRLDDGSYGQQSEPLRPLEGGTQERSQFGLRTVNKLAWICSGFEPRPTRRCMLRLRS